MTSIAYDDIVTPELLAGNIDNHEWNGFLADYRVLHCLVRKYRPKSIFEVGTNRGSGTMILKNAGGEDCVVFTLDMPPETMHPSLWNGGKDLVGINCTLPHIQLRGDSQTFDYEKYHCEFYYIDAEHVYENVFRETMGVLLNDPKVVAYHDTNIEEVMRAIQDAIFYREEYELFKVDGTRISYIVKKDVA